MKTLETTLTIGSGEHRFTYRQVIRKGMHAVYEQWQHGRIVAYETFKIMSHNGYDIGASHVAASESMPSASAWGVYGFTFKDKVSAIAKLARMVTGGAK